MLTNIVLSKRDLVNLQAKFEVSTNKDFINYFTAYVNERRRTMRNDLIVVNPSSAMIGKLAKEFRPSMSTLKHFAKKLGWRKDPSFISSLNSNKAKRRISLEMQKKAEEVINVTQWFRSIPKGEIRVGHFATAGKCKSVSSMLTRWNHTEGLDKGIFLSARYFWDLSIVCIEARAREVKN